MRVPELEQVNTVSDSEENDSGRLFVFFFSYSRGLHNMYTFHCWTQFSQTNS